MADALNNIIDLNIAIQEDNLEKAKILVTELNTQINELRKRFEIPEDQDIFNYFSLQITFDNFNNTTRNYVLDNFLGIDSKTVKIFKWYNKINSLVNNSSINEIILLLEETLIQDSIEKYQIPSLFRMINFTQRYDLFKILKEKSVL